MLLRSLSILLLLLLSVYSCDAPRLNPLDPQNPDYINKSSDVTYSIEGQVKTSAPPFSPISGVKVYWPEENKIVQTGESGNFIIDDVKKEDGYIYFEKDGFFSDSVLVEWGADSTVNVQPLLTLVPSVQSFSIFTEVVNSYRLPEYRIGIDVEIVDNDGIVDSVFIKNDELGLYQNILKQSFTTYYQVFVISKLGLSSIEDVVGKDFELVFIDSHDPNKKIIATKNKISRIIKESNDPISPINQDSVSTSPQFVWKRINRGYKNHFLFEIYTDESNGGTRIFEQDNISSSDVSLQLSSVIDNEINGIDQYYWVVWCIDEYNNKVRSKQGTFTVK